MGAINRNIFALRTQRGLSQESLALTLDVDKTAVSHWENGVSVPSGRRLDALADALGVTVPELFAEAA